MKTVHDKYEASLIETNEAWGRMVERNRNDSVKRYNERMAYLLTNAKARKPPCK
jgi:hypothetical protein